jgi:hypothetical protein
MLEHIKQCVHRDITCLEDKIQDVGVHYTHIYIAKPFELEPNVAACCHILAESLAIASGYTLVYNGEGALIYKKK